MLLWRDFGANQPNEKWTTDITCIWVENQCLYLMTVMNLYPRQILSWSLDSSMTEPLVTAALRMAFPTKCFGIRSLFCSRLKVELIYAEPYASIEAVKSGIFEYIEISYNRLRRHSRLAMSALLSLKNNG